MKADENGRKAAKSVSSVLTSFFVEDSAIRFGDFSSKLIASEFTAFKAETQWITWLMETPSVNYSSSERWTFCWPTNSTALRRQQPLLHRAVHSLVRFSDFYFPPSSSSLFFSSIWWCAVSLAHRARSERSECRLIFFFFKQQGQHEGKTMPM